MKKTTLLFLCLIQLSSISIVCNAQHYFWADNKKNEMIADSSILVLLKKDQEAGRAVTSVATDKVERYGDCVVLRNVARSHHRDFKNKNIEFAVAYRINSVPVIATNIVSFKPKGSVDNIERTFKGRIQFRDKTKYGVYHYFVNNFRETLSVANAIAESGLVVWCQPDFIIEVKATTADPLYAQQYYLNNNGQTGGVSNIDINAPEAWAHATGCYATRVAVLDYGVEEHEELGTRYQTGFTALNPAGTGLPGDSHYHGQACAGIIAASHNNNLGIAGISPTSLIIPVNGIIDVTSVVQIADGIDAAWEPNRGNADVLSNSWSWANAPSLNEITDAITRARTLGRNGLGAIVVFSAGNGGGGVEFPAKVEGVITVGAINKSGVKWSYSATGSSMDLVAPTGNTNGNGDVRTLDLSDDPAISNDNRGSVNGNYLSTFGGTSAAAPQVAGVAALMLSVNPNLTEVEVRTMLQQSATDMGASGFDNSYGYGRVDAFGAMKLVAGAISGPTSICTTGNTYNVINVPGGTSVTWSVSSNLQILSGQGTTSATINRLAAGNATISAYFSSFCGLPITLNVNPYLYLTKTYDFNCNENIVTANTSEGLVEWETTNGLLINGNPSPQSNIGNVVVISSPTGATGVITARTCFESNNTDFDPCVAWNSNLRFVGPNPGNPLHGEPIQAEADPLDGAYAYQWYSDYQLIETTPSPVLWTYNWQCGDHSLLVQAMTFYGSTDIQGGLYYWGLCSGFAVYPNPATNELNVSMDASQSQRKTLSETIEITLINSLHEKVYTTKTTNVTTTIPIQNLPKGVYYLNVANKEGILKRQVMIGN